MMWFDSFREVSSSGMLVKALLLLGIVVGYFIGNISPAIILGKLKGIDIRNHGSGNAGATNVTRTLGKKAGVFTLIVDISKGLLPVLLVKLVLFTHYSSSFILAYSGLVGIAVVLGHMFPIVFGLRGGKGVATSLGIILATVWWLGIVAFLIVAIMVLVFRMVSLGVMVACILCVPIAFFISPIYGFIIALLAVLIVVKHRDNIVRIAHGSENKLGGKK